MTQGNASNAPTPASQANAAHDIALPLAALVKLQAEAHTLRLPSAKATRSRQAGAYASPQRGRGMAFAEVRQYQPGDDIRAIDWRVTARRQQAHTKIYEEERERPVLLLCDLSPSLFFASTGAYKQVRAAQAAAMLAWVALFGGDRVGGLVFNGQLLALQRPARRKTSVLRLLDNLARLQHQPGQFHPNPEAPTSQPGSLDNALAEACRAARTGSRIFIISDFIQLSENSAGLLGKLAQHNSVSAVRISDPLEQALPRHGQFAVASAAGPLWFDAGDRAFRLAWQRRMDQHQERLQHCLRVAAVTSIDVSTGEHPRLALRALMAGGGRLG
jgi:uncharacterized protein (DUF58 family)